MAQELEFVIEGPIDTLVSIERGDFDGDGFIDLRFTVTVDETDGTTADLRGLFWDVSDESKLASASIYAPDSPDITDDQFAANSVKDLGNGANMNGHITNKGREFDAGVEIGTQGIGRDDIRSTSFVVTADGVDLTLDDVGGQRFGVRLTSYGEIDGPREGSLKIAGFAPEASAASIHIEKATNGEDADTPTGPQIPVGDSATLAYVVTNTGNVPLGNVQVSTATPAR